MPASRADDPHPRAVSTRTPAWRRWPAPGVVVLTAAVAVGAVMRAQENYANVQLHAFTDSRSVTVLSPTVDLSVDFTDRMALRTRFGVDAVSAASDSCVRCHPQGEHTQRSYINSSVTRAYGDTKVSVGGEFSKENFYQATTGLGSISRTLNQGNTTIAGGYSFSWNQPVLHPYEDTARQFTNDGYASVTQTVSKNTVVQVGYELSHVTGYQDSPFLRALVNGNRQSGNSPDVRTRQTLIARLRQALPGETYLEADYRRYFDSWELRSNTLSLGLSHYITPRLLGNFTYRRYGQTGAFFYAPQYFGTPEYVTGDFRLGPFDANLYTGRLVITPTDGFWVFPAASGLTLQYEFYKTTTGFESAMFTTGVRVPLPHR
ncbi:MAG: DUF3570 domain-containing protein [Vicinamibacterales bacterium]